METMGQHTTREYVQDNDCGGGGGDNNRNNVYREGKIEDTRRKPQTLYQQHIWLSMYIKRRYPAWGKERARVCARLYMCKVAW